MELDPNLHLTISFLEFKEGLQPLIEKGAELYERVVAENEIEVFKTEKKSWETATESYLKASFNIPINSFYQEFYEAYFQSFSPGAFGVTDVKTINHLKETIQLKRQSLIDTRHVLGGCDKIIYPNDPSIAARKSFTTQQKLGLLLEKLYVLHVGGYLPVRELLIGNGITLRDYHEDRELIKILSDNGYVDTLGGLGGHVAAKLTSYGTMYVEDMRAKADSRLKSTSSESNGNFSINAGNNSNIVVQHRTVNSSQEVQIQSANLDDIKQFIAEIRNGMSELKGYLNEVTANELEDDVDYLEKVVNKQAPDMGLIKTLISGIKAILTTVPTDVVSNIITAMILG